MHQGQAIHDLAGNLEFRAGKGRRIAGFQRSPARSGWPGNKESAREALGLKVADVRLVAGTAKSVRVIGKGDKERLVPLPGAFGAVFGFWLKDRPKGEFVFARAAGQKPVSSQAARAYLRGMLQKAGIEKKISPNKLRYNLRHQPAQRRGGTGGHQGAAGSREHRHHPDLHQRGAGTDGEGRGEVVRSIFA